MASSTLGDWYTGAADLIKPLWQALRTDTLRRYLVSLDDTGLPVRDRAHARGIKRGAARTTESRPAPDRRRTRAPISLKGLSFRGIHVAPRKLPRRCQAPPLRYRLSMGEPATTTSDEIDLGDHAEGLFDNWCRDVNAMATPPRKDKAGWDFYVVLPQEGGASLIDAPPKLNCAVQVKGQWVTTKQGPPIKLSNWETMISEPLPWFIFVLRYERPKRAIQGVLIHVDEVWTTRVMKRLWENEASEKADLSNLTMRVRWTEDELLPSLDGETILYRIRKHIGDASKYIENKRRWKTGAGLGPVGHTITLRLPRNDSNYAQLASAAVAPEESEMAFSAIETADVRFDIPISRGLQQVTKLTFRPHPLREKAIMIFMSATPIREEFFISFDVYSATSIFPFLPNEYRRIRLVAPLFRFEMAPGPEGTMRYRWEIDIEEADAPMGHLLRAARAMRVLLDPESPPCKLDLLGQTLTIDPGSVTELGVPDDVRTSLDAVINAGVVARNFGLDLDQIKVCVRELVHQEQNLRMLATIFSGSTPDALLRIKSTERELHGMRVAHVILCQVKIGDQIILLSIGLIGTATWTTTTDDGGEFSLAPSIRILERACIPAGSHTLDEFHEQVFQPMFDRGEALLDHEGLAVIRGDPMFPGTSSPEPA